MSEAIIENFTEITEEPTAIAAQPQPISNAGSYICSMPTNTRDDALALARALSNTDDLSDQIGQVLHMHNYVIQAVTITDPETGELRGANRIVLMCEEGNFGTVSAGVETSMRNLVTAMKDFPAPWDPPVAFTPVKRQGRNGYKFTTLDFA